MRTAAVMGACAVAVIVAGCGSSGGAGGPAAPASSGAPAGFVSPVSSSGMIACEGVVDGVTAYADGRTTVGMNGFTSAAAAATGGVGVAADQRAAFGPLASAVQSGDAAGAFMVAKSLAAECRAAGFTP